MKAMIDYVQGELSRLGDPAAAVAMAAYMKTDMPFYGVRAPERRPIRRELITSYAPADLDEYRSQVLALWGLPHREEKYLAIDVAGGHPRFIVPESLDLYERLIVEGAWWDLVDEVAVDLVGRVMRSDPDSVTALLRRWIGSDDLWLRRAAIISQNKARARTDFGLLRELIDATADEKEFFIRKAIGWALREYSRTDPDAVRAYLGEMGDRLSGLSRREAGKHLP